MCAQVTYHFLQTIFQHLHLKKGGGTGTGGGGGAVIAVLSEGGGVARR
jgi:hypothetical protein